MTRFIVVSGALLCLAGTTAAAQEPAWNAAALKECDRVCLVGVMDRTDVLQIYVADPIAGQVAYLPSVRSATPRRTRRDVT
jgi:hypothetical protein